MFKKFSLLLLFNFLLYKFQTFVAQINLQSRDYNKINFMNFYKMLFFVSAIGSLFFNQAMALAIVSQTEWVLNTSNPKKLEELCRLFSQYGIFLNITSINLKEIDADPLTVAIHKASQVHDHVLIEDTSLEVEGIDIGVNLRSKFEYFVQHIEQYAGKKATWTVLLAYKEKELVYLYRGSVTGTFVLIQKENNFSFDFLPDGGQKTYTEDEPERFNARALAVKAFVEQKPIAIRPPILEWQGPWQTD